MLLDRLAPRVSETARTLWKLYLGITLATSLIVQVAVVMFTAFVVNNARNQFALLHKM